MVSQLSPCKHSRSPSLVMHIYSTRGHMLSFRTDRTSRRPGSIHASNIAIDCTGGWLTRKHATSNRGHWPCCSMARAMSRRHRPPTSYLCAAQLCCRRPGTSVLGGISLLTVEELCAELGIRFEEEELTVQDCITADEAMLASTPYCLAGVSRINSTALPWPGPVWQRLLEAWSRRVGLDIVRQILSNH